IEGMPQPLDYVVELKELDADVQRRVLRDNVRELNTLRRHLSRIAGGRLALACAPAQLTTLVISDVTGDVLHDIGSGPTCGDPSSVDDVRAMLARFDVPVSPALDAFLQTDAAETPVVVPGEIHLVATPQQALEAAADVARAQGYAVLNLGAFIEADAVETAKIMAGVARQIRAYGLPIRAPAVVLSGGECTVTVTGTGCGGRNAQFAMGLAAAIDGMDGVTALAVDTDGVDGAADIAGAWVDGSTATRAAAAGYPLADAIAANDGHGLFERLGEQVITGPTLTNVNDFRAILVN
ncbi:MAG: glycerate kinase type-2 family protein, partial [Litorivicinus sp.]